MRNVKNTCGTDEQHKWKRRATHAQSSFLTRYLALQQNSISGTLPPTLCELRSLHNLFGYSNALQVLFHTVVLLYYSTALLRLHNL